MSDDWRDRLTDRVCPARGCGYLLERNDDGEPECPYHGHQPASEYTYRNDRPETEQVSLEEVQPA